jgi:PleD family two-component response regulator
VHTGTLALAWAPDLRPDAIVLDADLPDTSGIALCEALHGDLRIGHNVPILLLTPEQPTPEQRVAALRAGAWDFLVPGRDQDELPLTLQTYVQAKRNIDLALAQGLADPATGVHSRSSLARRARELGALMARRHGALACVVFALDHDATAGSLVVHAARVSDVVGALSPTEVAVLAPGTDGAGAVTLAHRIGAAISGGAASRPAATLRAGYEAVDNFTYAPIDPVELLTRAAVALRNGVPDPRAPWLRRLEGERASGGARDATPGSASAALASPHRRTSQ